MSYFIGLREFKMMLVLQGTISKGDQKSGSKKSSVNMKFIQKIPPIAILAHFQLPGFVMEIES